ncbi:hypothetical protein [Pseudomonas sp. zfem003]|uniref:hypothetical protein n=1 Tax=Pseudomonas sp. zfem003 TaxID=3078198 RepID=UPI00273913A6|nr:MULTISPECIES: hypothetical protein [unclassified Pseudomonas]MDL5597349.1 hypothetical protein [Bacillus subtilis]MDU9395105.1 hypothetical protein [Pseudomonas sp. zfem003]
MHQARLDAGELPALVAVPVGFLAAQAEDVVGLVAAAQGDEQRTAEQVRQVGFIDGGDLRRGSFAT